MFRFFLFVAIALTACTNYLKDPQEIIDKTIKAAGGDRYLNSIIEFDVHSKHYIIKRQGDVFSIEQIFKDSLGTIRDVVSNKGHVREINGMMEVLSVQLTQLLLTPSLILPCYHLDGTIRVLVKPILVIP